MGVRIEILCHGHVTFFITASQCVRFNNTLSKDLPLSADVPQGTWVLILIDDAASDEKSQYWRYVNDLTFAENSTFTPTMQGHLLDGLHEFSIINWSSSNGKNLNANKCQTLEINFSRNSTHQADLQVKSYKLEALTKPKF